MFAAAVGPLVVKFVLLTSGLALPSSPAPHAAVAPSPDTTSSPAVTMLPEVRLRKVHLVRPDLIPYPIAYEVVC